MKRVLIIGCSGSGKSTLGRRLGKLIDLPVVHMDTYFFNPGWVVKEDDEWTSIVGGLIAEDSWVMDGNYSGTMASRIRRADTVIFLDFPTWFCLYRVIKRFIQSYGKVRQDVAPGCPEKLDLEFLGYVWNYNRRSRPKMLNIMQEFKGDLVRLASVKEIDAFVAQLSEKEAI